jgi:hypothetical protein
MNTNYALPFSRRSILRVAVILVIGYALTAAAIQLWAQDAPPPAADGWVPVSHGPRAGSYGFAASDGVTESAASVARSSAPFIRVAYRPERDPRAMAADVFALSPEAASASHGTKPQAVSGLFGRGFYSHP